jgi:hypothetical protein
MPNPPGQTAETILFTAIGSGARSCRTAQLRHFTARFERRG